MPGDKHINVPTVVIALVGGVFMAVVGFAISQFTSSTDANAAEVARKQVAQFAKAHSEQDRAYDKDHEGKPHGPTEERLTKNAVKIAEVNGRVSLVEKDILYIKDGIKDIKVLLIELQKD